MLDIQDGLASARRLNLPLRDHYFGKGSFANLDGVDPDYITLVSLAIRLNRLDGTVIAGGGLRSAAQAADNVANGTGVPIERSEHRLHLDTGYGHAVDLIPYIGYPTWDAAKCREMAESVRTAAAILSLPIRQGLDWDQDGKWLERGESDYCHVEKPKPQHEAQAIVLMHEWREHLGLESAPVPTSPVEDWAEDMLSPGFPPSAGMPVGCSCPSCGQHLKLVAAT